MALKFGTRSLACLATTHPALVKLMTRALELSAQDFTIICGYRNKADQEAAVARGASKVHYPNSAHNQTDANGKERSCAVDILPYPFTNWEDPEMRKGWYRVHDAVAKASKELGIPYRWGGGVPDKAFDWDLPHFELHPWREWDKSNAATASGNAGDKEWTRQRH